MKQLGLIEGEMWGVSRTIYTGKNQLRFPRFTRPHSPHHLHFTGWRAALRPTIPNMEGRSNTPSLPPPHKKTYTVTHFQFWHRSYNLNTRIVDLLIFFLSLSLSFSSFLFPDRGAQITGNKKNTWFAITIGSLNLGFGNKEKLLGRMGPSWRGGLGRVWFDCGNSVTFSNRTYPMLTAPFITNRKSFAGYMEGATFAGWSILGYYSGLGPISGTNFDVKRQGREWPDVWMIGF